MFDAIVLAGGGKQDPLAVQEGVTNKAFIDLHGQPLLSYTLKALAGAPSIDRIVVVGPVGELELLQRDGYDFIIGEECGSLLDNVAAGCAITNKERLSLIVTGDIPLVTPAVIEKFIKLCAPHECDLYYPILRREDCLRCYPETERTYVRIKEGHVTGGNIGLLNPNWFLDNRSRLEMFIAYRKKPLKYLRILPLSFIFKFLIKQLSLSDLELHISRLLNLKARAVLCDCIEIAVDVDKVSDLDLVKKELQ